MKIKINGQLELDTDTLTAEQREQIIAALAELIDKIEEQIDPYAPAGSVMTSLRSLVDELRGDK